MDMPAHIKDAAENVINNLLPEKSASKYWKEYEYLPSGVVKTM